MEFCKAFNEKTKAFMGKPVPVVITVYKDKKFDFIISIGKNSFIFERYISLCKSTTIPVNPSFPFVLKVDVVELYKAV